MPRNYDLEFKLEAVRMAPDPEVTNRDVESHLVLESRSFALETKA